MAELLHLKHLALECLSDAVVQAAKRGVLLHEGVNYLEVERFG